MCFLYFYKLHYCTQDIPKKEYYYNFIVTNNNMLCKIQKVMYIRVKPSHGRNN